MRAAPAVRVTLEPPRAARLAVATLTALAVASVAAWVAGHQGAPTALGLVGLLPGAWAGWALGPQGQAELDWDGQRWACDGQAGRVAVQLDLQFLLLLRFVPAAGRTRWLLAHRGDLGPQGHGLRVALFAGRPEAASDPAGQPPLTP
jgi:hypothetical protein